MKNSEDGKAKMKKNKQESHWWRTKMGIQFTNTKNALNKIEVLFDELNRTGDFNAFESIDQAIMSSPMMHLAMMISLDDYDFGRDLYHALRAIYYREEEDLLWKK